MHRILGLRVEVVYGTLALDGPAPTKADHRRMRELAASVDADMGSDAAVTLCRATDTLSWPRTHIELAYSAFDPDADALYALAKVWEPKLSAAYGLPVRVDARTD